MSSLAVSPPPAAPPTSPAAGNGGGDDSSTPQDGFAPTLQDALDGGSTQPAKDAKGPASSGAKDPKGAKDVKASKAEVFNLADGVAVVYLFPFSAEISPRDKQVEFDAQIGRVVVMRLFDLDAMMFQGKLEL